VGAAGKLARLGIYDSTGTAGAPGALVVDGGTVTVDTGTTKEVTISTTLQPGVYWLAFVSDGAPTCASPLGNGASVCSIPVAFTGLMAINTNGPSLPKSAGRTADVAGGLQSTAPTLSAGSGLTRCYPFLRYV
jgi:hypothetical protein